MGSRIVSILLYIIAAGAVITCAYVSSHHKEISVKPLEIVPASKISSVTSHPVMLKRIESLDNKFQDFYKDLFKSYRTSSGHTLKVLGEAVSYAGEIQIGLQTLPVFLTLAGEGEGSQKSAHSIQNWLDHSRSDMDMRIYFVNRMVSDTQMDPNVQSLLNHFENYIDTYQKILLDVSQVLENDLLRK